MDKRSTKPNRAAEKLYGQLRDYNWYVSVGVGNPDGIDTLYVYVKYKKCLKEPVIIDLVNNGFTGLPVKVEVTGEIKAC